MAAYNYFNNLNFDPVEILSRVFVILCCFPVHECAHAWMAGRLGDPTARNMGRVTLNPFKHLDVWGTVMIFLFGVGYAKPVPVNIRNFKKPKLYFALTAVAGPVSNLIMAAIVMVICRIVYGGASTEAGYQVVQFLIYAAYINLSLAVFNLIPIPPLDGSRVVTAILPDKTYNALLKYERYSMVIILVLLLLFSRLGVSPISRITGALFNGLVTILRF